MCSPLFFLLWPSLSGPTFNLTNAQGTYSILGTLISVILGYYFGRLPSEKAADTANKIIDKANAVAETANKNVEILTVSYDKVVSDVKQQALDAEKAELKTLTDVHKMLQGILNSADDAKSKKVFNINVLDDFTAKINESIKQIEALKK